MNLIEICIAFVAAIISVGTPLVFQVISKFDEKYRSAKVITLVTANAYEDKGLPNKLEEVKRFDAI